MTVDGHYVSRSVPRRIRSGDYLFDHGGEVSGTHTLPRVFERVAATAPLETAATDGRRSWTWTEWKHDSDAVASGLQARGVEPNCVVAAHLGNTWEFLTLHTAVAEIGAVLLPIHQGYGPADVRSLLERVRPAAVVDNEQWHRLAREGTGRRPDDVVVDPHSPFMLIPSSGTTSKRPKICIHSHDGLLSNAASAVSESRIDSSDKIISASPLSHLFGLFSVHTALFGEMQQILLPTWNVDDFLALAEVTGATVLCAVPAQLSDISNKIDRRTKLTLKEIRTAGASVPAALVGDLRQKTTARIVVQWGMSEIGAGSFSRDDDPDDAVATTVGAPVGGAQARVVDGELHFRGPSLFRGYLDEPELTRSAMTSDGWLRTGDLADIDHDGRIVHRGRSAEQINVGGKKFNAREIEDMLTQFGRVAVLGRPDTRLGQYPCMVAERPDVTLRQVNRFLRDCGVSPYKIPAELINVEKVPLTPAGKINRHALNDMIDRGGGDDKDVGGSSPQGKRSTREHYLETIRRHTAQALDREDLITPDSNFRDYGLDSVSAIRLCNALSEATGRHLPATLAFDYSTPNLMARHLAGDLEPSTAFVPSATPQTEDPVVIVGMGVRLPGGISTPDEFWQALCDGRDYRSHFPVDRGWPADLYDSDPAAPGKSTTDRGGFLRDVHGFDHGFFGVTPREARAMDPQQRLLLEVCWEALERAGIDVASLRDSDTGVFVGMMASDYGPRLDQSPESFDGNLIIGTASSVASGRLAYLLGLHGPALTVDTACSSSLVALHLAANAIRRGECDRAIVGGVTVMSTPASLVEFSRQRAVSPDGLCKPFAASADGFGLSEGVAAVVLERLSEAQRRNHRILTVVRGSAINQDGASNGLSAPSGRAQQLVISRALSVAGLTADDVDVVEAHGTGTLLGDPIEAGALLATYGNDRHPDRPLWLGSAKSNVGHTQAASGLVGVLKMVLALSHETLPESLNIDAPNPLIEWSSSPIQLLTDRTDWLRGKRRRRVGVSSFGISGTNAHVILEEAPIETPSAETSVGFPWPLSAKSPEALRGVARDLLDLLRRGDDPNPDSIGRALARRSRYEHRAVALGDHSLALQALIDDAPCADLVVGKAQPAGKIAFVFPGQGAQWQGMGTDLLAESEVFAETIAQCEEALNPHVDWSLSKVLREGGTLTAPDVGQPVLFAVMVALSRLWLAHGVQPDAVVGHSQGEVAAAHVCGALSLADAARIVAIRSKLLGRLAEGGGMAFVPLDPHDRDWTDGLEIAAINGPRSIVVSGPNRAIDELVVEVEGAKRLSIALAGHSSQMTELRDDLLRELDHIDARSSDIPFYSTVTGCAVDTRELQAEYWYRNLREQVRFGQATEALAKHGHTFLIEISPHPILVQAISTTAELVSIPTLRREEGDATAFSRAIAFAYTRGLTVDWGMGAGRPAEIPTYPFTRERHRIGDAGRPAKPRVQANADPLEVLQSVATSVCGLLEPLQPDVLFQSQGITSLLAVEMSDGLSRVLDRRLPATALLDHNTPRALASFLSQTENTAPPSGFEQIYRQLCAAGAAGAAAKMLLEASRLRPAATHMDTPEAVPLTDDVADSPIIICFPSVIPLSAPTEYSKFATAFIGENAVYAIPQPGFVEGQHVPATREMLVEAHAATVRDLVGERPYVLCGHSSGGWIAYAVAQQMTSQRPSGIALLDSYWPRERFVQSEFPGMISSFVAREQALGIEEVGMTRLTATGSYLRLFEDWTPVETDVSVLHVAAEENGARWELPCIATQSPGNHFEMLDGASNTVRSWLSAVVQLS